MTNLSTVGEELVRLLHGHGVDTVFGIPGVHTVPLYRGLANGPIRHITPRHEQGAAFMADGLARASGKPGVCFLITGPGLTNAATAMAQAYADSVPMLVISSVNPARSPEKGEGRLHELPDQSAFARTVAASTHNLESATELPSVLARIFSDFQSNRPRPAHLQISTELLATHCSVLHAIEPNATVPVASASDIEIASTLLDDALQPLIIAGGGSQHADAVLRSVAERLDAPVVTTLAAKGVIADPHALCVGAGLGQEHVRDEIRQADVVLVVGSELAPTDLWPHESLDFAGRLIRIDIDPHHFDFEPGVDVALIGDSNEVLAALHRHLERTPGRNRHGAERTQRLRKNCEHDDKFERWLVPLRECLAQDTIVCADSTQIVYQAGIWHPGVRAASCDGGRTLAAVEGRSGTGDLSDWRWWSAVYAC